MKFSSVFVVFASAVITARADLVMQEQIIMGSWTNIETTKIHGNMIREDSPGWEKEPTSMIKDASTGDFVILFHQKKMFKKTSGAHVRERLEFYRKQSSNTNAADLMPKKLVDTGKSEKVDGYEANVFKWPGVEGSSMTYWIAKDYPDYGKMKTDLAVLDQFRAQGLGKGIQPDVGKLPGMVVKVKIVVGAELIDNTNAMVVTSTLISAKKESVDPSIFEIPKDYKELASPTNQPVSTTIPNP